MTFYAPLDIKSCFSFSIPPKTRGVGGKYRRVTKLTIRTTANDSLPAIRFVEFSLLVNCYHVQRWPLPFFQDICCCFLLYKVTNFLKVAVADPT